MTPGSTSSCLQIITIYSMVFRDTYELLNQKITIPSIRPGLFFIFLIASLHDNEFWGLCSIPESPKHGQFFRSNDLVRVDTKLVDSFFLIIPWKSIATFKTDPSEWVSSKQSNTLRVWREHPVLIFIQACGCLTLIKLPADGLCAPFLSTLQYWSFCFNIPKLIILELIRQLDNFFCGDCV